MKNGEALRLLFEVAPVRIGFRHVTAEDEMVFGFVHYNRDVARERAIVHARNQDYEWVRAHEGESIGMVAYAEMFGDVHGSFLSLQPDGSALRLSCVCTKVFPLR